MIRLRPRLYVPGVFLLVPALLFAWLNPWIPGNMVATWVDFLTGARRPASAAEMANVVMVPLILAVVVGFGMALIVWGLFTRRGAGHLLAAWFSVFALYSTAIWASGSIMMLGAWDLRTWPYLLWPLFGIGTFVIGLYWMTEPCQRRDIAVVIAGILVGSIVSIWSAWRNPDDRIYSLFWLFSAFASLVSYLLLSATGALAFNLFANIRREFSSRSCVEHFLEPHD